MKKVWKGIGAAVLAIAIFAGGYTLGQRVRENNIISALPHKTFDKPQETASLEPSDASPKPASGDVFQPEKNITEKNSETAVQNGWTEVAHADITLSDGDSAKIKLYTSAQKDENGEFMWDDGNTWLLEAESNGGYYALINKYIQLGKVDFTAGEDENGHASITAVISTGTGITVEKYTYNGTAFEGQTVYNSGILNVKGSTF